MWFECIYFQHLAYLFIPLTEVLNFNKVHFVNFPSHVIDLISKVYKEHIKLNNKKQTIPLKMGRGSKQTFFPKRYKWTIGPWSSVSLTIKQMQMKTIV